MGPLDFETINELYQEFIHTITDKRLDHIIPIVRDTFRNHYTPNIFTTENNLYRDDDRDKKIFIKDSIFTISKDEETIYQMLTVRRYVFDKGGNHQYVETISFRELIYIYCNPEGQLLLEKIGFEIDEIDWEQIAKDEWDEHQGYPMDDEIPF